jgi:hypothetical protein
MTDIRHTTASSLLFNDFTRRPLSAYKHNVAFVASKALNVFERVIKRRHSVLEIDNVYFISRPKNELVHFGVPEAGLVSEVGACLQQIAHAYLSHSYLPEVWVLIVMRPLSPTVKRHPAQLF